MTDSQKRSRPGQPLVSVVTVVYNGERHLEQTILSVLNQSYPNVESVVIDGGSTDGTPAILERYASRIDCLVSERDDGIALWLRNDPAVPWRLLSIQLRLAQSPVPA